MSTEYIVPLDTHSHKKSVKSNKVVLNPHLFSHISGPCSANISNLCFFLPHICFFNVFAIPIVVSSSFTSLQLPVLGAHSRATTSYDFGDYKSWHAYCYRTYALLLFWTACSRTSQVLGSCSSWQSRPLLPPQPAHLLQRQCCAPELWIPMGLSAYGCSWHLSVRYSPSGVSVHARVPPWEWRCRIKSLAYVYNTINKNYK